MELVVEFDPPRSRGAVERGARLLSKVFDLVDVPDAPLGKPNYSSPVISAYLAAIGVRVVAHLRVVDVNLLAMKTITKTLGALGVEKIVYLRGDPPYQGEPVNHVTPEEAVRYALRRPEAPEPGLLISLRKPIETIRERLRVGAKFYYILNYSWGVPESLEKLEKVAGEARGRGSKIYVYLDATRRLPEKDDILEILGVIDGIIVSAPGTPAEHVYKIGMSLREIVR